MKRIVLAIMVLLVLASCVYADVEINDDTFPDPLFQLCVKLDFDHDNDGSLSNKEIAAVKELSYWGKRGNNINGPGFRSLQGIEYFTELVSLDCGNAQLTELDLSKNMNLVSLNCEQNSIIELDLTRNTKLRYLNCKDNEVMKSLNIRGLKGLIYLNCDTNSLTKLDLTGCDNLEELSCCLNSLDGLDLSGNMKLRKLACWANNLRELDVSNHIYLTEIDSNMNYLEKLNASGCTSLHKIYSPNNLLTSINIEGCSNLWTLDVNCNRLRELDVSGHSELYELKCPVNMLVSLDVSGCGKLWNLDCHDNRLVYVNFQGCEGLQAVNFNNNQLEKINVGSLRRLIMLYCGWNRLSELDVSRNDSLQYLRCGNNNITDINLRSNRSLYDLELQYNNLAELDLSSNTLLNSDNAPKSFSANTPYGTVTINFRTLHVLTDHQTISGFDILRQSENEYPFVLDLSEYISYANMNNVIASSVRGFDESSAEIETVYRNGTVQFKTYPERVEYSYSTGHDNLSMDVTIGKTDFLSIAMNGHVYRAFNRAVSWENAKAYCKSLDGYLAVITSDDEKLLVQELIRRAKFAGGYTSGGYWLGGGRDSNDVWFWIDGSDFTEELAKDDVHDAVSRDIYIRRVINGETVEIIQHVKRSLPENVYLQITADGKFEGWHELRPSGFICEWNSISADMAPYSEEYRHYISSDFSEVTFGYIPSPVDYSLSTLPQTSYTSKPPAEYDPRDYGINLHVGNQNPYGTCWSFASLGALEASYVAQGYGSEAPNLSKLHQAWYAFNDPRNGYSRSRYYTNRIILDQGGTTNDSIAFLSRMGTALNSDLPYPDSNLPKMSDAEVENYINTASRFPGREPDKYPHPLSLKAVYNIGAITQDKIERVKHLIMDYGAVRIGYLHLFEYEGSNRENYYVPDVASKRNNIPENAGGWHAVILVGWDDNYPRSNFRSAPNTDGAWLALNSWGTNFGNGGYFWMSYAQETQSDCAVFIASDGTEETIYANDTSAAIDTVPYNWSASIFKAESDVLLNEVSFHTRDSDTQYEVYVNKFGKTEPENGPGVPQDSPAASGKLSYYGYHTVALNNAIELEQGEYFAVMVKISKPSSSFGSWYLTAAAKNNNSFSFNDYTHGNSQHVIASALTRAGISWFADSDTLPELSDWKDGSRLSLGSYNACIKALSIENGPVSINLSQLPSGTKGQQYSCSLTASGARPITWTVTDLPDGLKHDYGKITGIPSEAGTYYVKVSASNSKGSDSKIFTLTINDYKDSHESRGGGGDGGGCSSFSGIHVLLALSAYIFMKKR